jgi:hypothetical protein
VTPIPLLPYQRALLEEDSPLFLRWGRGPSPLEPLFLAGLLDLPSSVLYVVPRGTRPLLAEAVAPVVSELLDGSLARRLERAVAKGALLWVGSGDGSPKAPVD